MDTRKEIEEYEEYQRQVEAEVLAESERANPVVQRVKYARFVSKSKGRNRKPRRNWVEVHLVSFTEHPRFYSWHKAPFDVYATEILHNSGIGDGIDYPAEALRQEIIRLWGY